MPKKLNIGLLGCGGVARKWYLSGLAGEKDLYNLKAVADINFKLASDAAEEFNIPICVSSLEDLLNIEDLDLVVVLTRHSDHYEHIRQCLQRGLHVYSEKPFADSYEKALELIALAKAKSLCFAAAPQIMFSSRNKKVFELIDKGITGKISLVRASNSNMGPSDRKGIDYDPEWFYSDGGSLSSLGIYTLSTVLWLMGCPFRVAGLSGICFSDRTVMYGPAQGKEFNVRSPDNEVALLEYPNATYVLFDGSYSMLNPATYELEIHGELASIFVGGFGGPLSVLLQRRESEPVAVGPQDDCHLRWNLAWGVEDAISAIIEKRPPKADPVLAAQTIRVIEAIHRSSKSGKYEIINER